MTDISVFSVSQQKGPFEGYQNVYNVVLDYTCRIFYENAHVNIWAAFYRKSKICFQS
jgi:hypothetical protein